MQNKAKVLLRVEQTADGITKLSRVIEYASGNKVMIPINQSGVRWFDDSKLIKPEYRK